MKKFFALLIVLGFSCSMSATTTITIVCSNGTTITNLTVRDQFENETRAQYEAYLRGIADAQCGCINVGGCGTVTKVVYAPSVEDNLKPNRP